MRNLAVIPARGGSKRIPGKNIREFLGKPILAYAIDIALQSGLFSEVMVSTDDDETAKLAREFGAKVPFMRSAETSGDHATLSDVIEEVKSCYTDGGNTFDYLCCILATAPLIRMSDLKKGYKKIRHGEYDSIRPVVKFSYPIHRALKLRGQSIEMFHEEYRRTRSQDLEPAYHDAAQFYWMKFETGLLSNNKGGFEIPKQYVQDIDDEEDWKIAEIKYQAWFK